MSDCQKMTVKKSKSAKRAFLGGFLTFWVNFLKFFLEIKKASKFRSDPISMNNPNGNVVRSFCHSFFTITLSKAALTQQTARAIAILEKLL
jgi:hypothetical protein